LDESLAATGRWIGRQVARIVIARILCCIAAYERSQRGPHNDLAVQASIDVFDALRSRSRM
jgi:hypothetical protein